MNESQRQQCSERARVGSRARAITTTAVTLLTAIVSATVPIAEAQAQQPAPPPRSPPASGKALKSAGLGAAVGGLLSVGYYYMSERGARSGKCGPWNCALPYLSVTGAVSGLFMSREMAAQRRAERPRVGEALTFSSTEYSMPSLPTAITLRDSLLAVATDSGAQVMSTVARSSALRRRGAGLSDVRKVAISGGSPRLFIGTGSALWETPTTTGLLTRVLDGAVDALATSPDDIVVAASGSLIRIRHGQGEAARLDSLTAPAPVTSTVFDSQTRKFWVTTDSLLLELTVGDGAPTLAERATVSGQAQAIATSPDWVALALGSEGIAVWPRQALSGGGGVMTPILMRGEPRFAFDVAFHGEDLFVAGGVDGVTRISLTPSARILGSSRQAGYATSLLSDGVALWIGDGTTGKARVLRATP